MSAVQDVDGERRYRALFGLSAGYLPADFDALLQWQLALKEAVERENGTTADGRRDPSVIALGRLIAATRVLRMYVDRDDRTEVPHEKRGTVGDIAELLDHLDHVARLAPEWEADPDKRDVLPDVGAVRPDDDHRRRRGGLPPCARSTTRIRAILRAWCRYLDSSDSRIVLNDGGRTAGCRPAAYAYNKLARVRRSPIRKAPHWGWPSFNAFFHREIRPDARPIAAPDDPRSSSRPMTARSTASRRTSSRTDASGSRASPIRCATCWPAAPTSSGSSAATCFQTFLSGADYHRWHAPIDGTVREAVVVDGSCSGTLNAATSKGVLSQGTTRPVNTRGLIFIESDDPAIGVVCCMPIGITEISSITLTARAGDRVKKGHQLGYFGFGGSTIAVIFEKSAIDHFSCSRRRLTRPPAASPPQRPGRRRCRCSSTRRSRGRASHSERRRVAPEARNRRVPGSGVRLWDDCDSSLRSE